MKNCLQTHSNIMLSIETRLSVINLNYFKLSNSEILGFQCKILICAN
jgi:hypothetical protein